MFEFKFVLGGGSSYDNRKHLNKFWVSFSNSSDEWFRVCIGWEVWSSDSCVINSILLKIDEYRWWVIWVWKWLGCSAGWNLYVFEGMPGKVDAHREWVIWDFEWLEEHVIWVVYLSLKSKYIWWRSRMSDLWLVLIEGSCHWNCMHLIEIAVTSMIIVG
jgi:hypothetical protein